MIILPYCFSPIKQGSSTSLISRMQIVYIEPRESPFLIKTDRTLQAVWVCRVHACTCLCGLKSQEAHIFQVWLTKPNMADPAGPTLPTMTESEAWRFFCLEQVYCSIKKPNRALFCFGAGKRKEKLNHSRDRWIAFSKQTHCVYKRRFIIPSVAMWGWAFPNSTALVKAMVLSNERTGPDKTTNCSVVFWKFDPSLHFQPMFHPLCLWQHKGASSGNFSRGSQTVCIVTEKREKAGNRASCTGGRQENGWSFLAWHLNPKLDSPLYQKAKIFSVFGHEAGIAKWRFKSERTSASTICTAAGNGSGPSQYV